MTVEQILELIRCRIREAYAAPQLETPSQLDSSLFELHYLYAEATGQSDTWHRLRKEELANVPAWHDRLRDSHGNFGSTVSTETAEVVTFWKGFSSTLGVEIEPPP